MQNHYAQEFMCVCSEDWTPVPHACVTLPKPSGAQFSRFLATVRISNVLQSTPYNFIPLHLQSESLTVESFLFFPLPQAYEPQRRQNALKLMSSAQLKQVSCI